MKESNNFPKLLTKSPLIFIHVLIKNLHVYLNLTFPPELSTHSIRFITYKALSDSDPNNSKDKQLAIN